MAPAPLPEATRPLILAAMELGVVVLRGGITGAHWHTVETRRQWPELWTAIDRLLLASAGVDSAPRVSGAATTDHGHCLFCCACGPCSTDLERMRG